MALAIVGQKKEIVQTITDEIIVGADEIDIRLRTSRKDPSKRVKSKWVARGMVVDEDHGAGRQLEGPAHDFARIDRRVVDGPLVHSPRRR